MNKLSCKVCHYSCLTDNLFSAHLKSKRHLKMTTNAEQNVADNITLNIEPEEEIKEEKKLNTIDNSLLENLMFQNQMMMKLLMGQQQNAIIKENTANNPNAFDMETYLKVTCKDAINFEEIFTREYILNENFNKYVMYYDKLLLMKKIDYDTIPSPYKFASDFFCSGFNEIDHHKKPLVCSDVRRRTFYLRTENKWIKVDKYELIDRIWNRLITVMFKAFGNTRRLQKDVFKQIYHRDYDNWYNGNADKYLIILGSIDKELMNTIIPVLTKFCNTKYVAYKNERPMLHKHHIDALNSASENESDSASDY